MKLNEDFYLQKDVVKTARNLIGKVLVTRIDGVITSGIITETEAYAGTVDKASHAYGGRRTARTEVMYMKGGTAYVYLCYGMHALFNVVTNQVDIPHAVLIRSVYPLEGIETMKKRRNKQKTGRGFTDGPGKVSQALGISVSLTGESLLGNIIYIEDRGFEFSEKHVLITPRIGIDYAEEDALLPYRFFIPKPQLVFEQMNL